MGSYGSSLRDTVNSLNNFKASLNNEWQAEEMLYTNNAIDSITRELFSLALSLDSIDSEIIQVKEEIMHEDQARAAAAAASARVAQAAK